jgi:hypothetical protein
MMLPVMQPATSSRSEFQTVCLQLQSLGTDDPWHSSVGMSTGQQRKIYQGENGDSWWLCRERETVFVLHEANLPSGGAITKIALPQFLSSSGNPPERQALLQIIGELTQCSD